MNTISHAIFFARGQVRMHGQYTSSNRNKAEQELRQVAQNNGSILIHRKLHSTFLRPKFC